MKTEGFSKAKEIASEKLSELAKAVNTQRQVRALQKDISRLVAERDKVLLGIGHKVFALYERGKVRNQDIIPLCARIKDISTQIDSLNRQIQEILKPQPRGQIGGVNLEDETGLEEEIEEEDRARKTAPKDALEEDVSPPDKDPDSDKTGEKPN
ncbi:MAG: hypothetical protein ACUVX8_17595 [Candidatus Zipacnadales bacterium]